MRHTIVVVDASRQSLLIFGWLNLGMWPRMAVHHIVFSITHPACYRRAAILIKLARASTSSMKMDFATSLVVSRFSALRPARAVSGFTNRQL